MTPARYPTAEAIGHAIVAACRVTGEDPVKAFSSKGTARAQTAVMAALTLAYDSLSWAERARLAGVVVSCPRHHVKFARQARWWPVVGEPATEAARAALRLHVRTCGDGEPEPRDPPRAEWSNMPDAEAALIRQMAGKHSPQAIAERIGKTFGQVTGFAKREGISLKATPGGAYHRQVCAARSRGVSKAWEDPAKREAMAEGSRVARPKKAAPPPKAAEPPQPHCARGPKPVAQPAPAELAAPRPAPPPPPPAAPASVSFAEAYPEIEQPVRRSPPPAIDDPFMAQFKRQPPPGPCGRMAGELPAAAAIVQPPANRGSRAAVSPPAPIDPEKISDVARDLSRQEQCAEAIFVRQLRALRTPWSHIHRQAGARGTVDDLRRKYDPEWKEPARG